MNFDNFLHKLPILKTKKLGGLQAQFKLAPKMRLQYDAEAITQKKPNKAGVLALFYPNKLQETCILLTQRASYKGTHFNQISFPGGKVNNADKNIEITALRETFEEVGVPSSEIKIIREITDVYIPPSNFLATPFIGFMHKNPLFNTNYEVAEIIEIPISNLLNNNNISSINVTTSYTKNTNVPCFKFNNRIIWGATAMILSEIKELLK